MVYEIKDKFVDFNKWCKTCKYADLKKDKDGVMPMPCDECLGQGLNKNSTCLDKSGKNCSIFR